MKTLNLKYLKLLTLVLFTTIMVTSCGDDDVTGCTDPAADNYNPEATVSGDCTYSGCTDPAAENYNPQATNEDNSCVYARDKFIGEYLGSFECPGVLAAVNSDSIVFTIENGLDPDLINQVIITLKDISGFDVPLLATASGNMLGDINAELLGIPVLGLTSDVTGSGEATLSADDQTLTAMVTLTVSNILGDTEGTCTLVGTKQ